MTRAVNRVKERGSRSVPRNILWRSFPVGINMSHPLLDTVRTYHEYINYDTKNFSGGNQPVNNQVKEILCYAISAIGTIEAAIANTPPFGVNRGANLPPPFGR